MPDSAHLLAAPIALAVIEYYVSWQIAEASECKEPSLHAQSGLHYPGYMPSSPTGPHCIPRTDFCNKAMHSRLWSRAMVHALDKYTHCWSLCQRCAVCEIVSSPEDGMSDLRAPADKIVGAAAQVKDRLAGRAEQRGLCRHEAGYHNEEVAIGRPLEVVHWPFLQARLAHLVILTHSFTED